MGVPTVRKTTWREKGIGGSIVGLLGLILGNSEQLMSWWDAYDGPIGFAFSLAALTLGAMVILDLVGNVQDRRMARDAAAEQRREYALDKQRKQQPELARKWRNGLIWKKFNGVFLYKDLAMGGNPPPMSFSLARSAEEFDHQNFRLGDPWCTSAKTDDCWRTVLSEFDRPSGGFGGVWCRLCNMKYSREQLGTVASVAQNQVLAEIKKILAEIDRARGDAASVHVEMP